MLKKDILTACKNIYIASNAHCDRSLQKQSYEDHICIHQFFIVEELWNILTRIPNYFYKIVIIFQRIEGIMHFTYRISQFSKSNSRIISSLQNSNEQFTSYTRFEFGN